MMVSPILTPLIMMTTLIKRSMEIKMWQTRTCNIMSVIG
jgi:hypothetical protein